MYRSLLFLLYIAICAAVPKHAWDSGEPSETQKNGNTHGSRHVRQADTTLPDVEPETTELATETPEVKVTLAETPEPARTTISDKLEGRSVPPPSPRFYSKLSYFQKNANDRLLVNLLESKSHRRKFRSKCRCEKISNCPRLQMSVGRCPEEYFMCCF